MDTSEARPSEGIANEPALDFQAICERMRRVVASLVRGAASREDVDDGAQDAALDYIRALRAGGIRDHEAMQVLIAKRKAFNLLRRLRTERSRRVLHELQAEDRDVLEAVPTYDVDPFDGVPPPDDLLFAVHEIARAVGLKCVELFERLCLMKTLRVAADELGISHDAALQRWSRCRRPIIELLFEDPGPLGEWTREHLWRPS